jgi:outer membrane lipoprotein-sorting protein
MIRKAILLTLLSCVVLCLQASAQTVDELIKKNIEARGGLEKMKAIKTMRITGKAHSEGMNIPLVIQIKRPGLLRADATVQGVSMSRLYDGESAWEISSRGGSKEPEKLSGYDERETIEIADIDGPLVDYKAKGSKIELVGKEELEATPVYKLKVTLKNGDVKYIYLDAGNYLALKETEKRKEDGSPTDVETLFSNYKAVAGVMIPHSSETRVNGALDEQMTIEKVEVNVPVDDSIFKLPRQNIRK